MFKFTKPKWTITKDKKVYETPIFSLHEKEVLPDDGSDAANFYVLNAPEWINVIALTPENSVVLVEQYRHGIDETTLEIPGGMVDEGEEPLEAAKRELLEETGYESDAWESLGKASSNPAILSNFTHIYLARDCKKTSPQQTDGHEDILGHSLPLKEFLTLVGEDVVHHSIVLAGVAKFLLKYPDLA
jgi:8-oxo-dGTP pyrophosphatase MutT (NUDIX family)